MTSARCRKTRSMATSGRSRRIRTTSQWSARPRAPVPSNARSAVRRAVRRARSRTLARERRAQSDSLALPRGALPRPRPAQAMYIGTACTDKALFVGPMHVSDNKCDKDAKTGTSEKLKCSGTGYLDHYTYTSGDCSGAGKKCVRQQSRTASRSRPQRQVPELCTSLVVRAHSLQLAHEPLSRI